MKLIQIILEMISSTIILLTIIPFYEATPPPTPKNGSPVDIQEMFSLEEKKNVNATLMLAETIFTANALLSKNNNNSFPSVDLEFSKDEEKHEVERNETRSPDSPTSDSETRSLKSDSTLEESENLPTNIISDAAEDQNTKNAENESFIEHINKLDVSSDIDESPKGYYDTESGNTSSEAGSDNIEGERIGQEDFTSDDEPENADQGLNEVDATDSSEEYHTVPTISKKRHTLGNSFDDEKSGKNNDEETLQNAVNSFIKLSNQVTIRTDSVDDKENLKEYPLTFLYDTVNKRMAIHQKVDVHRGALHETSFLNEDIESPAVHLKDRKITFNDDKKEKDIVIVEPTAFKEGFAKLVVQKVVPTTKSSKLFLPYPIVKKNEDAAKSEPIV